MFLPVLRRISSGARSLKHYSFLIALRTVWLSTEDIELDACLFDIIHRLLIGIVVVLVGLHFVDKAPRPDNGTFTEHDP